MKLSDVCFEMHQGINTVADKVKYYECGTPILQSKNITNGILDLEDVRFVDENDYNKYKERYIPHKGNILLSNIGTIGKSLLIDEEKDFLIAWNIFLIKVNESKINSKFLNFYFQYLDMSNYYNKYLTGGTVKFINKKTMENIEIPNISLVNQIKIADELEKVQKMINIREKQIKKLDELIKSQFVEMFGKEAYDKKCLNDISVIKGEYGSGASAGEYIDEMPRYIRITDIQEDGELNNTSIVSPKNENNLEKYTLSYGDILFARTGATVGKTYKYSEEDGYCIYAGYCIRFRLDLTKVNPDYIFIFTKTEEYKRWVTNKQRVVAQPNINAKEYGNDLLIPIPPIELQNQFAEIVKQINKQKFEIQKSLEEMQKLQESLMNKYFGG